MIVSDANSKVPPSDPCESENIPINACLPNISQHIKKVI